MTMRVRRFGILTGALLLAAALGGCETMNALLDDKPAGQTEQAEVMPPQPQDVAFVQQAAAAGDREVALAEYAAERADDDAVESFARQMADELGAANAELAALAERRGIALPETSGAEQAAVTITRLENLEGEAFDLTYVQESVQDHEATIALFEEQAAKGSDAALVAFAEERLPTLRAHLEHARTLQRGL